MLKRITVTFGFRAAIALVNLVVVVVLSRQLGAEGRGVASLLLVSISMVQMVCGLAGGATLVYLVPRHDLGRLLLISHGWSALVSLISLGVLLVFPLVDAWMVPHVASLGLLNAMLATQLTALLGRDQVHANNAITLVQALLTLGGLLLLFAIGGEGDVMHYVQVLYAAYGAGIIASLAALRPRITTGAGQWLPLGREAMRLGAVNMSGTLMNLVNMRVAYYLLSHRVDDAAVGVYSNASSLVESVWLISNSMAMVQYAAIANSGDDTRNRSLTLTLVKLSTLLCLLALGLLMMLPDAFHMHLFGPDFAGVRAAIVWLTPGVLMHNLLLVVGHYFSGSGKYHVNSFGNLAGLLVTLALTLILLPGYGLVTAAAVTSASRVATGAFVLWWFLRGSGIRWIDLLPSGADVERARGIFARILGPRT